MEKTGGVAQAAALKAEETIVAFVRPASGKSGLVKETVTKHLSCYCAPARIISLGELPKTANRKVAKKKLRDVAKKALNARIEDSTTVLSLALAYGAAMSSDSAGKEEARMHNTARIIKRPCKQEASQRKCCHRD